MLTYPKSTMRVRRMPMHLSSGHVTLMPGKFKFLQALENDQFLVAHFPPETGALFATFFKGESKIALKCSVLDEGSLEPKGVAS